MKNPRAQTGNRKDNANAMAKTKQGHFMTEPNGQKVGRRAAKLSAVSRKMASKAELLLHELEGDEYGAAILNRLADAVAVAQADGSNEGKRMVGLVFTTGVQLGIAIGERMAFEPEP